MPETPPPRPRRRPACAARGRPAQRAALRGAHPPQGSGLQARRRRTAAGGPGPGGQHHVEAVAHRGGRAVRAGGGPSRPVAGPAPARGRPRGRAGTTLGLRCRALQLTASLGLRTEPALRDTDTARTPPRPAQLARGHCGASAGGAAGLIQPIGCRAPGPAPCQPGPAQEQPPPGKYPAGPGHAPPAAPPKPALVPPGVGPPPLSPQQASFDPRLAPPRAPSLPFCVQGLGFGPLLGRGLQTPRGVSGFDLRAAVSPPRPEPDILVTR